MENKITNKGGRPPAEVTNQRIIEVMRMFYRGRGSIGSIMLKLGVSQTTASCLRKKAFQTLQKARGEDVDIAQSKYLVICRLENLIAETWKIIDKYDLLHLDGSVNVKDDMVRLKHLNFILSCEKIRAELEGHIQGNPRNQINFLSIEQKIIMTALKLNQDDFNEQNIGSTLLRLADLYKNGNQEKPS